MKLFRLQIHQWGELLKEPHLFLREVAEGNNILVKISLPFSRRRVLPLSSIFLCTFVTRYEKRSHMLRVAGDSYDDQNDGGSSGIQIEALSHIVKCVGVIQKLSWG